MAEFYGINTNSFDFERDFQKLTDLFTDGMFAHGTDLLARKIAGKESYVRPKGFFYIFEHIGSMSFGDIFSANGFELIKGFVRRYYGFPYSKELGAAHADDVWYLFKTSLPFDFTPRDNDVAQSEMMLDLWVNFLRHRHPTPKIVSNYDTKKTGFVGDSLKDLTQSWRPTTKASLNYARLADGKINFDQDQEFDSRMKMWREFLEG